METASGHSILVQAQRWLTELEVKTEMRGEQLLVNRTDMVCLAPGGWESQYDEVLDALRKALNQGRLFWAGKDDEWLFLDVLGLPSP
jgi:hypothetical protein